MNTNNFNAYNVVTSKDGRTFWNKIGAAFPFEAKDGRKGFNIPNMQIVVIQPKDDLTEGESTDSVTVLAEV